MRHARDGGITEENHPSLGDPRSGRFGLPRMVVPEADHTSSGHIWPAIVSPHLAACPSVPGGNTYAPTEGNGPAVARSSYAERACFAEAGFMGATWPRKRPPLDSQSSWTRCHPPQMGCRGGGLSDKWPDWRPTRGGSRNGRRNWVPATRDRDRSGMVVPPTVQYGGPSDPSGGLHRAPSPHPSISRAPPVSLRRWLGPSVRTCSFIERKTPSPTPSTAHTLRPARAQGRLLGSRVCPADRTQSRQYPSGAPW